ncbi:RNA-binding protein [Oscillatoria sp. CS-180]|uniref:Jag family protein n=1 Tax=Oscillatoria sp. CS-180 TaxID=3021720 RepID=UPI00232D1587|nr:R3H domain-containing nucleic acid-binding protein [Oscillatoria sp. CS-180]MDB9528208.1 RNA-binding protein [Oscillatoria sp. CS-180]
MENSEQTGIEWLLSLLKCQGVETSVSASMVEDEFGASCWLTIDDSEIPPEQVESLIGEKGHSLDAVQYLANTVLNLGRSPEEQQPYTIELAGHRAKRKAELIALAAEAAETAKETGEEFEMVALSSAERRQVHHYLKSHDGLETFSRGREPDRRLVVRQLQ